MVYLVHVLVQDMLYNAKYRSKIVKYGLDHADHTTAPTRQHDPYHGHANHKSRGIYFVSALHGIDN